MKPTKGPGSLNTYLSGFILSLILTLVAYFLVAKEVLDSRALIATIIALAVVQLLVQVVFFLHVDRDSKPFWNLQMLLFAGMVVFILVVGSLWIMSNLDYNMMSPHETDQYIQKDEAIYKN